MCTAATIGCELTKQSLSVCSIQMAKYFESSGQSFLHCRQDQRWRCGGRGFQSPVRNSPSPTVGVIPDGTTVQGTDEIVKQVLGLISLKRSASIRNASFLRDSDHEVTFRVKDHGLFCLAKRCFVVVFENHCAYITQARRLFLFVP